MARLNDLPAPAESVEALKRRFVRQNREIARANSIQSLRIQTLEAEVSHLLQENAALREQVIALTQDMERADAARDFRKEFNTYKEKVASKLEELSTLVDDMGAMPDRFFGKNARKPEVRGFQQPSAPVQRMTFHGEEDGRLPAIMEDKYFPRRTLEPQEIEDAREAADAESPSIGSPPVAHLDVDRSPTPESEPASPDSPKPEAVVGDQDSPSLSRATVPSPEQLVVPSPTRRTVRDLSTNSKASVKSGSKRKFNADDDIFGSGSAITDDDFQFSRASTSLLRDSSPVKEPKRPQPKRKALEPKTTNMPSPRKRLSNKDTEEPKKSAKGLETEDVKDPPKLAARPSKKEITIPPAGQHSTPKTADVILGDRPTQPEQENNTDQPPVGPAGRPARRSRPAISYAEPNLRDKMRRPTDELVDAVLPDKFRRTSQIDMNNNDLSKPKSNKRSSSSSSSSSSSFKENSTVPSTTDTAAGEEQTSFEGLPELPNSVITNRKRKTLSAVKDDASDESAGDTAMPTKATSTQKTAANRQMRRHSSNPNNGQDSLPESIDAAAEEIMGTKRSQRVGSRRRSMMV